MSNIDETPILSHTRRSADLQSDQEKLEQLASSRTEIKTALQLIEEDDCGSSTDAQPDGGGYFVLTSSFTSSMFQMAGDDAEQILRDKLKNVEEEIVELCGQIQRHLDLQNASSWHDTVYE